MMHQVKGFSCTVTHIQAKLVLYNEISLNINQYLIKSNQDIVNQNQINLGNQWRNTVLIKKLLIYMGAT